MAVVEVIIGCAAQACVEQKREKHNRITSIFLPPLLVGNTDDLSATAVPYSLLYKNYYFFIIKNYCFIIFHPQQPLVDFCFSTFHQVVALFERVVLIFSFSLLVSQLESCAVVSFFGAVVEGEKGPVSSVLHGAG